MLVAADNVKRNATVETAAKDQKVLEEESVRRRGLREAARTPAVLASDAARAPLLPKMGWKPVTRFPPAVATSPAASASPAAAAASPALPPAVAASLAPATTPPVARPARTVEAVAVSSTPSPVADTASSTAVPLAAQTEDPALRQMRLELRMYEMVRAARPELSHD